MKNSAEVAAEAAAAAPAAEAPASEAAALGDVPPAVLVYVSNLIARQTREFELRLAEQKEELETTMAEQKEEMEATMAEQKEELEAMIEEQKAKIEEQKATLDEQGAVLSNLIDPRLSVWNVGGSSSTSNSTPSIVSSSRKAYRTHIGVCMGCGSDSNLSIAHIVSHRRGADINVLFGTDGNYIDGVDVESERNYLVLCGSHGQQGTCHNYFDSLQMSLYYCREAESDESGDASDEEGVFKWFCSDVAMSARMSRVWRAQEMGEKYVRLLNWRTLRTILQPDMRFPGPSAERTAFINNLKIWEEAECND